MKPSESLLSSIEALVAGGKAVVSADKSIIVAMMQEALSHGRSATFYVAPAQAQAVMRLYWSPWRIKEIGMTAVSKEERMRIENELGIKDMGPFFSNRIQCPCGGVYGAFEFMQQGLREHGRDMVGAIVELKNVAVLRINPEQDVICPSCRQIIITNHWYSMYTDDGKLIYGCCSGGTSGPILT
jgi:hypothetical protein